MSILMLHQVTLWVYYFIFSYDWSIPKIPCSNVTPRKKILLLVVKFVFISIPNRASFSHKSRWHLKDIWSRHLWEPLNNDHWIFFYFLDYVCHLNLDLIYQCDVPVCNLLLPIWTIMFMKKFLFYFTFLNILNNSSFQFLSKLTMKKNLHAFMVVNCKSKLCNYTTYIREFKLTFFAFKKDISHCSNCNLEGL